MIRVYTAQAIAIVGNGKNVLEANGIPAVSVKWWKISEGIIQHS